MKENKGMITVYYDGACPKCVNDRYYYEKLSGRAGKKIRWFDITGQEEWLREIGIDPQKALMELHVKKENQQILSEIDAYILLMSKVTLLRPLAWLIGLPLIRPILSKVYHWQVNRRLWRSGRLG
jgi:predicted DCC family thiol-disulfide oxidoreductase YuxK